MSDTKRLWVLLTAAQAVILVVLAMLIAKTVPRIWKVNENLNVPIMSEEGQIDSFAEADFYETPFRGYYGEAYAKGAKFVNDYVLNITLEDISTKYVMENGDIDEIKSEKIISTANDFSYTLSGAKNGAVWQVLVSFGENRIPYVSVIKLKGASK